MQEIEKKVKGVELHRQGACAEDIVGGSLRRDLRATLHVMYSILDLTS